MSQREAASLCRLTAAASLTRRCRAAASSSDGPAAKPAAISAASTCRGSSPKPTVATEAPFVRAASTSPQPSGWTCSTVRSGRVSRASGNMNGLPTMRRAPSWPMSSSDRLSCPSQPLRKRSAPCEALPAPRALPKPKTATLSVPCSRAKRSRACRRCANNSALSPGAPPVIADQAEMTTAAPATRRPETTISARFNA
jgi:hypothetical protein